MVFDTRHQRYTRAMKFMHGYTNRKGQGYYEKKKRIEGNGNVYTGSFFFSFFEIPCLNNVFCSGVI